MKTKTSIVAENVRLQQWSELIRESQNRPSDMKLDVWCEERGITKANYYYRLRRVREAYLLACEAQGTFVELPVPERVVSSNADMPAAAKVLTVLTVFIGAFFTICVVTSLLDRQNEQEQEK